MHCLLPRKSPVESFFNSIKFKIHWACCEASGYLSFHSTFVIVFPVPLKNYMNRFQTKVAQNGRNHPLGGQLGDRFLVNNGFIFAPWLT